MTDEKKDDFLEGLSQTVVQTVFYTTEDPPLPINYVRLFVDVKNIEDKNILHKVGSGHD